MATFDVPLVVETEVEWDSIRDGSIDVPSGTGNSANEKARLNSFAQRLRDETTGRMIVGVLWDSSIVTHQEVPQSPLDFTANWNCPEMREIMVLLVLAPTL